MDGLMGKNTVINFLVPFPMVPCHLKSISASDKIKVENMFFHILDEIVISVGEKNVVQVIIENASNYVLVGKMLETK
jgi:hypothetical protein